MSQKTIEGLEAEWEEYSRGALFPFSTPEEAKEDWMNSEKEIRGLDGPRPNTCEFCGKKTCSDLLEGGKIKCWVCRGL